MDEENVRKYYDWMRLWQDENGYDPDNPPPYLGSSVVVSQKLLNQLEELNELGWYELVEIEDEQ
jgi:transposase-like protein